MRYLILLLTFFSFSVFADPICTGFSPQPPECEHHDMPPPHHTVPEPDTYMLLAVGMIGLWFNRRKVKRNNF